jgi:hypothetical protein
MGVCSSWPDPDPMRSPRGREQFERSSRRLTDSRNDCDEAYSSVFMRATHNLQLTPRRRNELEARPVLDRFFEFSEDQLRRRAAIGLQLWTECKHKIEKPPILVQYQSCYPLHCFYVNRHSGLPMRVCGVSTHFERSFVLHAFVMLSCEHVQYVSDVDPCDILSVDKWNPLQLMMIKLCPIPGYFCDPLAPLFSPVYA